MYNFDPLDLYGRDRSWKLAQVDKTIIMHLFGTRGYEMLVLLRFPINSQMTGRCYRFLTKA
jgi:hypothetical protein